MSEYSQIHILQKHLVVDNHRRGPKRSFLSKFVSRRYEACLLIYIVQSAMNAVRTTPDLLISLREIILVNFPIFI